MRGPRGQGELEERGVQGGAGPATDKVTYRLGVRDACCRSDPDRYLRVDAGVRECSAYMCVYEYVYE